MSFLGNLLVTYWNFDIKRNFCNVQYENWLKFDGKVTEISWKTHRNFRSEVDLFSPEQLLELSMTVEAPRKSELSNYNCSKNRFRLSTTTDLTCTAEVSTGHTSSSFLDKIVRVVHSNHNTNSKSDSTEEKWVKTRLTYRFWRVQNRNSDHNSGKTTRDTKVRLYNPMYNCTFFSTCKKRREILETKYCKYFLKN